jgi:predicted lipid-binding transport protein (Tim44 family)
LVAIGVIGCGSNGGSSTAATSDPAPAASPSESLEAEAAATIRDHVQMFTAAFGSGDMETACRLFDPKTIKPKSCESIYGKGSAFTRSFLTAKIERVVVNGDKATVALSNGQIIRMADEGVVNGEGGYWEVEDLGGEENTTR